MKSFAIAIALALAAAQLVASSCGPCDRTWSEGSSQIEGDLTLPGRATAATQIGGLAYWGYGTWQIAASSDDGVLVCLEVDGVERPGTFDLTGIEALACMPAGDISGDYPLIDYCGGRDQCAPLAGILTVIELQQECEDRTCATDAEIEIEASTEGGLAVALTGSLDEEIVEGCSSSSFL